MSQKDDKSEQPNLKQASNQALSQSASDNGAINDEVSKKDMLKAEAIEAVFANMKKDGKDATEKKITHKQQAINKLRRSIKINDTFAAILALSGMVIALLEYEIYHEGDGSMVRPPREIYQKLLASNPTLPAFSQYVRLARNISTPLTTTLRFVVTLSTGVLLVPLFFHMLLNYRLAIFLGKVQIGTNILKTSFFRTFILEVLINLIHCPPFFDSTFTFQQIDFYVTYSTDLILSNLMILRIYLALRLFAHYTKWLSDLSMKYCEMEGCEANTAFALKSILKESPYLALFMAFLGSAVLLGVPLKNFEASLNENIDVNSQDFSKLWNAIWLIVITMTTVGFGDFFARTHIARFVSVISIFWGIFLTSMMVVTLTNSMTLDAKESRAFNILYRLKVRENLRDKATFIVTLIIRAKGIYNDFDRRRTGGKFTEKEIKEFEEKYEEERAELYSRLDIAKGLFLEAESNLKSADDDPVEEIRKLSLSIEHDFNEMRNFFIAIKEIEANLISIHRSHQVIEKMISECQTYNNLFSTEILQFKGGIFDIDKFKNNKAA